MGLYVDALRSVAGKGRQVVDDLARAAGGVEDASAAARLATLAGQVALEDLRDTETALGHFQAVLSRYGPRTGAADVRDARIGIGDVWRLRGEYDKALAAYRLAGSRITERHKSAVILRGDLARHVEAYIRDGMYVSAAEFLDRWARALPADQLDGYWSWMHARLLQIQRKHGEAIRAAETLVKVNPRSNYGAQLLMLAHRSLVALEREKPAADMLRRIVKEFPESPLAAEAEKLLKEGA